MLGRVPVIAPFHEYDFQRGGVYVAAVSGGSDSTALLFLLEAHLEKFYPGARLIAATVDHGLREASAGEARAMGALCAAHGIEHEILEWTGDKPTRGIQAAARLARHGLLAEFAGKVGAAAVFTGHTRDDLAETVIMRNARGEGTGSAGIAPATLHDGRVWFARPLLGTARSELRAWLSERGIGWNDDPSNSDGRFERARLRHALREAPDGFLQAERALASAADAAALRTARAHWAASLLRRHAARLAPGLVRLDRAALEGPDDTIIHTLRVLVAIVGGAEYLPDVARTGELLGKLRAGAARATFARSLVDARKDAVYFLREARGLPIEVGTLATWDRRYALLPGGVSGRVDSSRLIEAPGSLLRAAARTEPELPQNWTKRPLVAPWSQFLPVFDLVLANEAARLVGADAFPPPPFRSHIEVTA